MSFLRGLVALLVLPVLMMMTPAAAEAHSPGYGAEHCAIATEEMDMIFIRAQPTNYARIEKRLNAGVCGIDVTGRCRMDWCPVSQGRFDGWMHRDQIVAMSAPVYCVARAGRGWTLDLHEGPSRTTKIVASLHENSCGIALTPFRNGPWVRIEAYGQYGWVASASLR